MTTIFTQNDNFDHFKTQSLRKVRFIIQLTLYIVHIYSIMVFYFPFILLCAQYTTQEDEKKGENSNKDSDMSAIFFFSDLNPIKQKYSLICKLMKDK